jgi:hypothetical protein
LYLGKYRRECQKVHERHYKYENLKPFEHIPLLSRVAYADAFSSNLPTSKFAIYAFTTINMRSVAMEA